MAADDGEIVGFEEGMSWLPSHVLDEACDTKINTRHDQRNQEHHHRSKNPTEPYPMHSKYRFRANHRQRYPINVKSGAGMQAIFLGSDQKSCGTGVFLPRTRANNDFHPSKKPACSVLLPSRVVQALNLNVHELGMEITPRRDEKNHNMKKGHGDRKSDNNMENKDASAQCSVISQKQNYSPEIFLPKEWTY